MDPNIAAWLIAGGPRIEIRAVDREREHRRALLESRRVARARRPTLLDRIRAFLGPASAGTDRVCCPA